MQEAYNHKRKWPLILAKFKVTIKKCKIMIEKLVRDEMELENQYACSKSEILLPQI